MGKSILQTTMKAALRNSDGKISLGRIGESVFAGGLSKRLLVKER